MNDFIKAISISVLMSGSFMTHAMDDFDIPPEEEARILRQLAQRKQAVHKGIQPVPLPVQYPQPQVQVQVPLPVQYPQPQVQVQVPLPVQYPQPPIQVQVPLPVQYPQPRQAQYQPPQWERVGLYDDVQQLGLDDEEQFQLALALSMTDLEPTKNVEPPRTNQIQKPGEEKKAPEKIAQEKPEKEIKVLAKPSVNLIDLARYILARPSAIQTKLTEILETDLQFIEMPMCAAHCGINLPQDPLNLEGVRNQAQVDFVRFCNDKEFNYDVALSLFTHFWNGIIKNPCFNPFSETYKQIWNIVNTNKGQIVGSLAKVFDPQGEHSYQEEHSYKELLGKLGIADLYQQLTDHKNIICRDYIVPLKKMTPEQLLAQGPVIDDLRLGGKKAVINQLHAKEEAKPQLIVRPALDVTILRFQNRLNQEFEERKKQGGEETVMAYGKIVAKLYHKDIEAHINGLWKQLNRPNMRIQSVTSIAEIIKLHDNVKGKEDLEHSPIQAEAIKSSLETSFNCHTNPLERTTFHLVDKTQYDYLLMVSSQVFRFNQTFQQENKVFANTLLAIFFDQLIEQKGKCQAGMIGRLLVVHKTILDMLIEYYNTPIKL